MKKSFTFLAAILLSVSAWAATPAQYPGGAEALTKYLSENTVYPSQARANGIEGVVTVAFKVGADGRLSGLKVMRMVDPDLEAEALRVVGRMPAWTPATDDTGQAVPSEGTVAVPFSLGE